MENFRRKTSLSHTPLLVKIPLFDFLLLLIDAARLFFACFVACRVDIQFNWAHEPMKSRSPTVHPHQVRCAFLPATDAQEAAKYDHQHANGHCRIGAYYGFEIIVPGEHVYCIAKQGENHRYQACLDDRAFMDLW